MRNNVYLLEISPPEWLIRNEKDSSIMALIPGGKFLAGDPPFEIELPTFYAGITTVTNAQYALFLTEIKPVKKVLRKWISLDENCSIRPSSNGYEAYKYKVNHPVVQVSWFGAQAYCEWAGLRLPSELEWEKAARFTDGREYPWGNNWDESLCRNDRNRGKKTTSSVFYYPKGVSHWGLYQMSGNVWEWCQDFYYSEAYQRYKLGDLTPPGKGEYNVVRGGSWNFNEGFFCCSTRNLFRPDRCNNNSGFRVFRSITP